MVSPGLPRSSSTGLRPSFGASPVRIDLRERDLILRFATYEVDLLQHELRRAGTVAGQLQLVVRPERASAAEQFGELRPVLGGSFLSVTDGFGA